jgi:hypothetical protein
MQTCLGLSTVGCVTTHRHTVGPQPRAYPTSFTKFIPVHLPRTRRDIRWPRCQVRSLAATVCAPFGGALKPKFTHKLHGLKQGVAFPVAPFQMHNLGHRGGTKPELPGSTLEQLRRDPPVVLISVSGFGRQPKDPLVTLVDNQIEPGTPIIELPTVHIRCSTQIRRGHELSIHHSGQSSNLATAYPPATDLPRHLKPMHTRHISGREHKD